eukprot:jgi/Chlat1/8764/Chrsp90S00678
MIQREALEALAWDGDGAGVGAERVGQELAVSEKALRKNPKAYGAWYQRKWLVLKSARRRLASTDRELALVTKLLALDARNFHAWDYRKFLIRAVSDAAGVDTPAKGFTPADELSYTASAINKNFSNYSAWHYRTALLAELAKDKPQEWLSSQLREEFALVRQAFYTEPDDQAGWFYHRWLICKLSDDSEHAKPHVLTVDPPDGGTMGNNDKHSITLLFSEPVTNVDNTSASVSIPTSNGWRPVGDNTGRSGEIYANTWTCDLDASFIESVSQPAEVHIEVKADGSNNIKGTNGSRVSAFVASFYVDAEAADEEDIDQPRPEVDGCWPEGCAPSSATLMFDNSDIGGPLDLEGQGYRRGSRSGKSSFDLASGAGYEGDTDDIANSETVGARDIIQQEIAMCRELIELEPDSKWPRTAVAMLLDATSSGGDIAEMVAIYERLAAVDPMRGGLYKDRVGSLKLRQAASKVDAEVWSQERSVRAWLDLSRLGAPLITPPAAASFMWMRRLDLSHNRLRSLEGIEALQQLIALCVRHNKLERPHALLPLRHLHRLQALDIAYNELRERALSWFLSPGLKAGSSAPQLTCLDLRGNPALAQGEDSWLNAAKGASKGLRWLNGVDVS